MRGGRERRKRERKRRKGGQRRNHLTLFERAKANTSIFLSLSIYSLGKPPYNYMVAYGKQTLQLANMTTKTTNTTSTSTDRGVWSWLERLEMEITAVT